MEALAGSPAPAADLPENPAVSYGKEQQSLPNDASVDRELEAAAKEVAQKLASPNTSIATEANKSDAEHKNAQPLHAASESEAKLVHKHAGKAEDGDTPSHTVKHGHETKDKHHGTPVQPETDHPKIPIGDSDQGSGEIPLFGSKRPHVSHEDDSHDTIVIDPDGTFRTR